VRELEADHRHLAAHCQKAAGSGSETGDEGQAPTLLTQRLRTHQRQPGSWRAFCSKAQEPHKKARCLAQAITILYLEKIMLTNSQYQRRSTEQPTLFCIGEVSLNLSMLQTEQGISSGSVLPPVDSPSMWLAVPPCLGSRGLLGALQ